jgi:type II secretory pathway pseudopilin PulG
MQLKKINTEHRKSQKSRVLKEAFTLIELLVAISLMVFLISIVAYIFKSATLVYSQNEDLINISNNARAILEVLSKDIIGTMSPSATSKQCFRMVNGGEDNKKKARDMFAFNSITTVLGQTRPVRVKYTIVPAIAPKTKQQRKTVFGQIPLWKFQKHITELNGDKIYTADGKELNPEDLSEFLVFFNVWYLAYTSPGSDQTKYFELDEPPGVDENGNSYDAMISNDIDSGPCIGSGENKSHEDPKLPMMLQIFYQVFANEKEQVKKIYTQQLLIQAR